MRVLRTLTLALCAAALTTATATAALTLEQIFGDPPPVPGRPDGLGWRPGHEQLLVIDDGEGGRRLVGLDPATGERTVLLTEAALRSAIGAGDDAEPLDRATVVGDGSTMLVVDGEALWLVTLDGVQARRLSVGGPGDDRQLSPDGRRLAIVRDHDLWVSDLATGGERRLTEDGSETVFNGVFDWVYWEELASRKSRAFAWSESGGALAWLRLDDGAVPTYHLVDVLETHSKVREQRYPKPGDPLPTPSLHAVRFAGGDGATVRVEVELEGEVYLPRFGFLPQDRGLWYQVLDRSQDRLRLVAVPWQGTPTVLVDEVDPYWVEPVDGVRFLDDGSLLWQSRRSGFMHLERIAPDGARTDLTPGAFDVTELVGTDPAGQYAWYVVAAPSPRERRLRRVDLETLETVELASASGSWSGELSPQGGFVLAGHSAFDRLPRDLVLPSAGGEARDLGLRGAASIDPATLPHHRFVTVPADDGTPLEAMLIEPATLEPGRRYPVLVHVYGGPHAQTVRDVWGRSTHLFHHWLVEQGVLVFSLDNRGSAARGREFEGFADRKLGSAQLPDQLAGVRWLAEQPHVDPERIGIWGWSYGGYMTLYALTAAPDAFATGVAVAPVTDWRLYDAIYTERYMSTPEDNPDGYAAGSVLERAGQLSAPALVLHGTGDDNVHPQNTLQLADLAWREGRRFDLFLYPNLGHGLRAKGSSLQVFQRIADHLLEHLGEPVSLARGAGSRP